MTQEYVNARAQLIENVLLDLLRAPGLGVPSYRDRLAQELDDIEPLRSEPTTTELVAVDGHQFEPMRQIRNSDAKANVNIELSVVRLGDRYVGRGRINGNEFDCNPKSTQLDAAKDIGQQLINPANQKAEIALAMALSADVAEDARQSGGFF